jgi:GNAT superfamily N-acetyltransferase
MDLLLRQSSGWDDVPQSERLLTLVDHIGYGEPYFYTYAETTPAAEWLPAVCQHTDLIFTAYDATMSTPPDLIGYCIMVPYTHYQRFGHTAQEYGVEAESCVYIAEFGVAEKARGKSVGSLLLTFASAHRPPGTSSYLVRTLVDIHGTDQPNPAIKFYEKHGFTVVNDATTGKPLTETLTQRPRLFLRYNFKP